MAAKQHLVAGIQGAGIVYPFNSGVWVGQQGQLANVFRGGVNAPGVDGWTTGVSASINSAGQYAFAGELNQQVGYARDGVIWTGTPGNIQVAAREGDVAPGTEPTTVYSDPYLDSTTDNFNYVQINDNSEITFTSTLRGPGIPQVERGLWTGKPGQLQLVARENHQAADVASGINFSGIFQVTNSQGLIAFEGFLSGNGVDSTNNAGIWAGGAGSLHLVVRSGSVAPGAGACLFNVLSYDAGPTFDSSGQSLFLGSLTGSGVNSTNNIGYWYGDATNPTLLFRTGQAIPGFNGIFTSLQVKPIGPGKFMVAATFTGPGVNSGNDSAIFVGSATHLDMLAREGMQSAWNWSWGSIRRSDQVRNYGSGGWTSGI